MKTPHHGPAPLPPMPQPILGRPSRGYQLLWLSLLVMLARRQTRAQRRSNLRWTS